MTDFVKHEDDFVIYKDDLVQFGEDQDLTAAISVQSQTSSAQLDVGGTVPITAAVLIQTSTPTAPLDIAEILTFTSAIQIQTSTPNAGLDIAGIIIFTADVQIYTVTFPAELHVIPPISFTAAIQIQSQTSSIVFSNFVMTITAASSSQSQTSSAILHLGEGSQTWGHSTGVEEDIVSNFTGSWSGTGVISGSGDSERLELQMGQYKESDPIEIGVGTQVIELNKYSAGTGWAKIKYKTGATESACNAASWATYNYATGFSSAGWAKVRVEVAL